MAMQLECDLDTSYTDNRLDASYAAFSLTVHQAAGTFDTIGPWCCLTLSMCQTINMCILLPISRSPQVGMHRLVRHGSAGVLSEEAPSGKQSQQQGKPEQSPPKEGSKEKAPAASDKVSTLLAVGSPVKRLHKQEYTIPFTNTNHDLDNGK